MASLVSICTFGLLVSTTLGYNIIRDYSGSTFFDGWDFYGAPDNLTLGNVNWVSQEEAMSLNLAYVNSQGHVILKVDNTTNVTIGENRNAIRITSSTAYELGSLWLIDANHIPYGCSVWPAFWSFGPKWPDDGEIDIIEAINLMPANQMAIHTTPGCTQNGSSPELGTFGSTTDCSTDSGCTVLETSANSYLAPFATAGGGVWATQFEADGINIWFWSRPNVPTPITQATSTSPLDVADFGTPHASFPSTTCNISQFFSPQNLVIDTTLCGVWAGLSFAYGPDCGTGPTGLCYNDTVVGPGSPRFDNAYWDISYVRTYTSAAVVPSSTTPPSGSPTSGVAASSPVGANKSSAQSLSAFYIPLRLSFAVYPLLLFFMAGDVML
ncbi:glycoside hydrolase family 16 protein [Scleroderma citrinum Foug A]|uniref:Glycoside hydrolase family 16 protein n=1 Tax=Scleroderma citrinum Foug A TaxID=1036808 RepID=A0A0C3D7K3_9AGAM|nr:glycoside hydrolase family 16 protein [Scleroderma citrinum Foug A]